MILNENKIGWSQPNLQRDRFICSLNLNFWKFQIWYRQVYLIKTVFQSKKVRYFQALVQIFKTVVEHLLRLREARCENRWIERQFPKKLFGSRFSNYHIFTTLELLWNFINVTQARSKTRFLDITRCPPTFFFVPKDAKSNFQKSGRF